MKKFLLLLLIGLTYCAMYPQIAWPPKTFPCKVPFTLPAEIQYYWDIKNIICTGRSNGGYKFKVTGVGRHDHSGARIDMLYIKPAKSGGFPEASVAGTYFFPETTKGKSFYFDFVAAWPGRTPNRFTLFFKSDWVSLPDNPEWEDTVVQIPEDRGSHKKDKDYGNTGNLANIEKEEIITDRSVVIDRSQASPEYGTKPKDDEKVYDKVETMPEFPGGMSELYKWIGSHLRYPETAIQNRIQGRVIVKFVVGKDGKAKNPSIIRGADRDLDREALRLVNALPSFIPGKSEGKPVDVWFTLPFNFRLTK